LGTRFKKRPASPTSRHIQQLIIHKIRIGLSNGIYYIINIICNYNEDSK
jgi:hypothetical protein